MADERATALSRAHLRSTSRNYPTLTEPRARIVVLRRWIEPSSSSSSYTIHSMAISAPFSSHRKFLNFRHHGFTSIRLSPAATTISPQPLNPKFHLSTHSHIAYLPLPPPMRLSTSDSYNSPLPNDDDANAKDDTLKKKSFSTKEAFMKLKRYGSCGILAYGLLNTAYYITTFLVVWFYVAPSPGKMGYFVAVQRFVKVMAMVWAGSQVTKIARAAGALALAPFVEKALSWSSNKFKFRSQARAYMTVVGICIGMALGLFLAVTVMSA